MEILNRKIFQDVEADISVLPSSEQDGRLSHEQRKPNPIAHYKMHGVTSDEPRQEQDVSPRQDQTQPVQNNRVLLLQGPIGPFFGNLQNVLEEVGFATKRVLFHAADVLYGKKENSVRFSGNLEHWHTWLHSELSSSKPSVIVLFGSSRPAHQVARKLALKFGIEIIALEEGYLRSGYITCERGGNNHHSPLLKWASGDRELTPKRPLNMRSSFTIMCVWGACYYLWRDITKKTNEQELYHRKTRGALYETYTWTAHIVRKNIAKIREQHIINDLIENHKNRYILIPLQTPSDSQIRIASRGWNNEKLIQNCLQALHDEKSDNIIVFKTHPLDENAHKLRQHIYDEAKKNGVEKNIRVLQSGKIGALTKNSSGMIVINSTSAFSALNHNIPLLVIGDAIFRHPDIAIIGEDQNSIRSFLQERKSQNPEKISTFIRAVKATALLPGDFYALSSQRTTALEITHEIKKVVAKHKNQSEAK